MINQCHRRSEPFQILQCPCLLHCPGGLSDTLSQLGIALQLIEQHSHHLGCIHLCFKGKPLEEAVL